MSNSNFFKTLRVDPKETEYLDRQTASNGDIAYDKQVKTLRVFDGTTKGGAALSRADLVNVTTNAFRVKSTESKLATVTYTVTITGPQGADTGNKYNLNGVYRPIPNFVVGYTYVFIQDDQTNVYFPNVNGTTINAHPLNFSSDNLSGNNGGGTSYLVDVRYFLDSVSVTQAVYNSSAFNTASSRQVWITVTNATPAVLYYWCWNHTAMGNSIAVADPGSGTGTGGVSVEDSVPTTTDSGSLWLDTNTGILYVYYDDGTSGQWIQPTFPYPDVTNLATVSSLSAVATSGNYSDLVNTPSQFELSVAADDSTQVSISSGETIRFVGAGGVTTTSDPDGTITITGGGTTGNVTFSTTTIDSTDSSAITFTPAVVMQSDLTVENDLTVSNSLTLGLALPVASGGTGSSTGNLGSCTADGTNPVGYRNIPNSGAKTTAYTLVATDVGKFIELGTGGSVVVPASIFAAGDIISIFNNTSGSISCTCSAITDFYKGGTDSDISSFSVTTRGVATILFITATRAVVTGNLV